MVSDIPAGDGKTAHLILQCISFTAVPINLAILFLEQFIRLDMMVGLASIVPGEPPGDPQPGPGQPQVQLRFHRGGRRHRRQVNSQRMIGDDLRIAKKVVCTLSITRLH